MKRELDIMKSSDEKRVKKSLSIEAKILRSWRTLVKNPNKDHTFDDGKYILNVKQNTFNSTVHLSLIPGFVEQDVDLKMSVISNVILELFHNEPTFQKYKRAVLEISITGFKADFFTGVVLPDGWYRMDSITKVFYRRGPFVLKTEIRGIDSYREPASDAPSQVLETWSTTIFNVEPTTTALEIKRFVEDNKDQEKRTFIKCPVVRLDANPFAQPPIADRVLLPTEMTIVEMRPYAYEWDFSEFWQNYYKNRIEMIRQHQKPYNEAFLEGDTDWSRPISQYPQMCDISGNMLFVAYAVAETENLM